MGEGHSGKKRTERRERRKKRKMRNVLKRKIRKGLREMERELGGRRRGAG